MKLLYITILASVLIGCSTTPTKTGESKNNNETPKVGIANPASTYCIEQGGELSIKKDETGGEYGICKLKDGIEIEEWKFFRENQK